MVGSAFARYFEREKLPFRAVSRGEFDVLSDEPERLFQKLACPSGTYVVNAIGAVNRRASSASLETTVRVNTLFPHKLAEICRSLKLRLIHLSTDCVFSGEGGGYTESSSLSPVDSYGMTKALGEPFTQSMVIRTSFIGPEVKNFYLLLSWVLSQEGKKIPGYVNHFWNGMTSLAFARALRQIIEKNLFEEGLFHLFSPEVVTKEWLIRQIARSFKVKCEVFSQEAAQRIDRHLKTEKRLCHQVEIPSLEIQIDDLVRSYQEECHPATP